MSRYIDADALMEKLKQHHDFFVEAWGGFKEMPLSDKARCDELTNCIAEIVNAPSIDIVRCGECKHWCKGDEVYGICYRCPNTRQIKTDDFCSYGCREEE